MMYPISNVRVYSTSNNHVRQSRGQGLSEDPGPELESETGFGLRARVRVSLSQSLSQDPGSESESESGFGLRVKV